MLALRALLPSFQACRTFGTAAVLAMKQLPPRPKIEEADIEENFLKGDLRLFLADNVPQANHPPKVVVLVARRSYVHASHSSMHIA